jgi:type VI secretion system protein ImpG
LETPSRMDDRLLDLYNTELRHLRETAAEFGRDYPKIANRLRIDPNSSETCEDPYVERLLEGFAFLAARIHLKLDAEYPRFTQGLIETVYPDYLCPTPAMTVVKFEPDEQDASLAPGFMLPRGTVLRSQLAKGERTACTFTTAHAVRMLPLEVTEVRYFTRDLAELGLPPEIEARAALRIRFRKTISNLFSEIMADPLVIHLRGGDELPAQIFEEICTHRLGLVVQSPGDRNAVPRVLSKKGIRRMGFQSNEALLPPSPRGFEGYRFLREYFAFPQRLLFLELSGFQSELSRVTGDEFDLVIPLAEQDMRLEGRVTKDCVDLFCTPAINLFPKTLDRVMVSNRVSEFHVIPDRNRPLDFEIYQLSEVTGFGETPDQEREFRPFYQARDTDLEANAFYTANRLPRMFSDRERRTGRRSSYSGTDVFISIVDGDMTPRSVDIRQLGIRALCTNRHLPIQMAKGIGRTDFSLEVGGPIHGVRILSGPTVPRPSLVLAGQDPDRPNLPSGRYAWRLTSHLSLNYLSLLDSEGTGAEGMREMLKLYVDPNDRQGVRQIEGLRSIKHRPITRRIEAPGPITFARGLEVTLNFDESAFEGQGVFMMGSVLEQFLTRHVSLNSFTETVIATQQRKEIIRWPARTGRRQTL